jgi:hypothetical protein
MKLSWRRILRKKGISPVIGMVLISAVLFSVMALYFVWRASQEEFQLQRERERIQQLKLVEGESVEFLTIPDGNLNGKLISIYNNGSARPNINHLYVNDTEITSYNVSWDPTNSRMGTITINENTDAETTSLKVESQVGNLYAYSKPSAVIEILSIGDFGDEVRVLLDGSKSNTAGAVITDWYWELFEGGSSTAYDDMHGARVTAYLPKETSEQTWKIELTVADSTDNIGDREHTATIWFTAPGSEDSGSGEGDPGFGGEGAPGGIYISLGGTGGGSSVAEGRTISFNIKNFSGKMIPLTSLRFYGVKNPSNYTVNQIYVAPYGKVLTASDLHYDGVNISDGMIAPFLKSYYLGDGDEAHVELRASSGARPQPGHIFMVIMYDAATPQSYYVVQIPIRTDDYTDDVLFDPGDVFHVTSGGAILQGKALDLNLRNLMEVGVAFSTPSDTGDPCDDRMIEFNVAGTAFWSGSVGSESTICLGSDTDADGVPDTGVTWDNSRTIQFIFNFSDAAQRFYYFVYRLEDGTSLAHKIPRFTLDLAAGEPERQDADSGTGGTFTWGIDIVPIDQLNTPMELSIAGLPCYCTATFTPGSPVNMPNTITLTIEVLPGAPTGFYPIVITGNNKLNAESVVIFLFIS